MSYRARRGPDTLPSDGGGTLTLSLHPLLVAWSKRSAQELEALAKRVVEEALAEGGGVKGAILALRAIEVADPAVEVTANVELPADPEAIGRMSLRELEMLEARGLLGATEGATASAGELEQAATPDPA